MGKVVDIVNEKIVPVIEALGYEVVEVEYKSMPDKRMHLIFYIYHENGITLDDCERVNNAIDAPLDEADPTSGAPYSLDVSSPGLDRIFKTARDFERNMGKEIEVKLYSPAKFSVNPKAKAQKVYEGILSGFDGKNVVFKAADGEMLTIPFEKAAAVRLSITFDGLGNNDI